VSIYMPNVGAKGQFRLDAPLDNLLNPELEYTCTGVRTISDASGNGIDVVEMFYTPLELSQADFVRDVVAGAVLVTLQSGVSEPIVVPSSYFIEMPQVDGVKYQGLMVALDLSILPMDFDIAPLKLRLTETVKETIGVDALSKTIVTTLPLLKTYDDHVIIESTRENNMTVTTTDYGRFLAERDRADSLQQQVTALTNYIQTQLNPSVRP